MQTPNLFILIAIGLALLVLGNIIGRWLSIKLNKSIPFKFYYIISIPLMIVFLVIISFFPQYNLHLFALYILIISFISGFTQRKAPDTSQKKEEKKKEEKEEKDEGKGNL